MGSGTPCKDQMQVECLLKEVYDRLSMLATWFWPDVSSGIDLFLRILAVADDGNTRHQGKTRSMSNNVLGCCLAALCSQLEDCSRDSNPDMQGYPLNDTLTSPPNAPCRFLKGCINTALSLSLSFSLYRPWGTGLVPPGFKPTRCLFGLRGVKNEKTARQ